ncbi:hypothetical protein IU418_13375 [Nocardia farcinica]|uniref:hypothetical protein n=1 Tax=Nocardia farcinica TaxID=37329 RepID=UPI001B3C7883|nr:hypothetical protein [Nocardia farcinica]MBF6538195.1 hypothetical protein [Nocardia farcinica]
MLPAHSRRRAALPGRSNSSGALPAGTWTRLPKGVLYEPPPIVPFNAEGVLTVSAVPHTVAAFGGEATLQALAAAVAGAGFTAEGTFVVPTNEADALFEAVGALSASAVPHAVAQFTAAGILAALGVASASAGFTAVAALGASVTPTATAGFSGAGTLSAVASIFNPSSMTKSGTFSGLTNGFVPVTGWVADTTNYPGSSVSGSDLVVQSTGTGKTVSASVVWTASGAFARNVTMRLKNQTTGAILATGDPVSVPGNGSATATVTATGVSVTAGDLIRLEADGGNTTSRPTAQTNTNSYVRVT